MDNELLRKVFGDRANQIVFTDTIESVSLSPQDAYIIGIAREAVERGHLQSYLDEFQKIAKRDMRSRVAIFFDGYDADPREVYQIPEVRSWANRLLKNIPHLFYFLTPENFSIRIMFLCLVPVIFRDGEQVAINERKAKLLIEKITRSAVSYAKKRGDSEEKQVNLVGNISRETGYDQIV